MRIPRFHSPSRWIFLLALACLFNPAVHAAELNTALQAKAGLLNLTIRYDAGQDEWAQNTAEEAALYIPLVEQYLGVAIPAKGFVDINGCESCGAKLEGGQIYLPYSSSAIGNPSVLFHEIGHYWFGYQGRPKCQDWLAEGIASFLPVALRHNGLLSDTLPYHEEIERWWGLWWLPSSDVADVPLCPFSESLRNRLYAKSFKLQHIMYLTLGAQRYQSFLKALVRRRPLNNKAVIKMLERIKHRNWRRFLSGWVLGPNYRFIAMNEFLIDSDGDLLSRAEEKVFKLSDSEPDSDNDLIPDGAEIYYGLNPKKADSGGADFIRQKGPFIDGNELDWPFFSWHELTDPAGDQSGPAWADLLELRYAIQDSTLYVLLRTNGPPPASDQIFFDILVDTDADGHTQDEFAFWLSNPHWPWHYNYAADSSTNPYHLYAGLGSVIEMSIPLGEISAESFRILPIIRDHQAGQNLDRWSEWIEVTP